MEAQQEPEISDEVLHRALRAKISNVTNDAIVQGAPLMREYFDAHPDEAFFTKILLDAYAIAMGYKLVDATLMAKSVREIKASEVARKKQWQVRRACATLFGTDGEQQTALLKRYEELLTSIDVFERQQLAALKKAKEQETLFNMMKQDAERGLAIVSADCASMRAAAHAERESLLRDATVVAEDRRAAVLREIATLEERKLQLAKEVKEQALIRDALLETPEVLEEWRRRSMSMRDIMIASAIVRDNGVPILDEAARNAFLIKHKMITPEEVERRKQEKEKRHLEYQKIIGKHSIGNSLNPFVHSQEDLTMPLCDEEVILDFPKDDPI